MKQEHIYKALKKYPMPAIISVDSPSEEWKMQRFVKICKYIKELEAAESSNDNLHSAKS